MLLVEDDVDYVFIVLRAFLDATVPCKIVHVWNGNEAIDYMTGAPPYSDRQKHPEPDLLITDLKMPLMDGLELLSWLHGAGETSRIPVVLMSSSLQETQRSSALALGARAVHEKPHNFFGLVALARELSREFLEFDNQRASVHM